MRNTTVFIAILIATSVLLATDVLAKDKVYRWVDENGVVHFEALPDKQINAERVKIQKSRDRNTQPSSTPASTDTSQQQEPQPSYAQQQRDKRAKKRKEAAEKKLEIAAGCEQQHQLVARLEPSSRVMLKHEDGTVSRLDNDVRLEKLAEAKAYIVENCGK